ncbi:MAG TPA: hypothetical protein VFS55_15465 [Dokdonella sp.]|nr:hypothetical protein [Dokdonella sp.]
MLPRTDRSTPTLHEPGRLRFAGDRLPWQRSLRWEIRPRRDRRLLLLGGFVAFIVTLVEVVGFGLGMQPYRHPPRAPQVITVDLVEPFAEVPPPPPEPEPPIVARPSRIAISPPEVKVKAPPPHPEEASDAMRARIGEGGAGAAPQLFNPDGSIRLGGSDVPSLPPPPRTEREAARQRWEKIAERGNPLDCRKTRFSQAFAPDLSLGDKVAGKYLKWVGLADQQAIRHRAEQRAESGGCEPAP